MTDWNKAKVVDLKAELKRRGLPQTGLKPALVARLAAADDGDGSESEATVQGDGLKLNASAATSPDTVSPTQPSSSAALPSIASEPAAQSSDLVAELDSEEVDTSMVDTPNESLRTKSANILDSSQTPSRADEDRSALPSVEPQEALDDRQKRKRRSQTPPPSVTDAARKRFRANDEAEEMDEDDDDDSKEEALRTEADSAWAEKHNAVDEADMKTKSEEAAASLIESGPTAIDVKEEVVVEGLGDGDRMDVDLESRPFSEGKQVALESLEDSSSKTRDSRFKDLFPPSQVAPAMEKSGSRESDPHEVGESEPDRIISPAIHPATAALYIRDFMRPLNPAQLKEHLAHLATPPGQNVDLDIVIKFYLDPIRTHAFISFKNISAASRVRSALHSRIWPDERNRKALWVDFIPMQKVEEWIHVEESSKAGGRAMAKKWEIVYDEDEDRHVTATLREASTLGGPPGTGHLRRHSEQIPEGIRGLAQRPPAATQAARTPFRGIEGAPSGPRAEQNRGQIAATNLQTLDQLFRSTTAKPVLYWEPVSKAVANKRLDAMEVATAKDYSSSRPSAGDINRYTFEDHDVLVDRGPEIFPGIRPPVDSRGPPGQTRFQHRRGGPQGRRGFGGDRAYDSYRGDRRGSRDDRR